jgi:hypothetical protein
VAELEEMERDEVLEARGGVGHEALVPEVGLRHAPQSAERLLGAAGWHRELEAGLGQAAVGAVASASEKGWSR